MSSPPKPDEYIPRILGMRHQQSQAVTELVILGRDQVEALSRMLDLFKSHGVELLGLESQSVPETKHFVITAYVRLDKADRSLEALLELLRGLLAVESAKGKELGGSAYEAFLFPVVALDGSRLVITTTENMVQVEKAFSLLPARTGSLILFATGRQSGLALIRSFRRSRSGLSQGEMLARAEDELRTSGWGLVSFDVGALTRGTVGVVVRDSIMVNAPGETESWLTYGLCAGLIEGIFGMVGHASADRSYSAKTRELKFNLVELTVTQRNLESGR